MTQKKTTTAAASQTSQNKENLTSDDKRAVVQKEVAKSAPSDDVQNRVATAATAQRTGSDIPKKKAEAPKKKKSAKAPKTEPSRSIAAWVWAGCALLFLAVAVGAVFVDLRSLWDTDDFPRDAFDTERVVEYNGTTWVAHNEPKVSVEVFTSADCTNCDASIDHMLVFLHRLLPTMEAVKRNIDDPAAAARAEDAGIGYVPAFVVSSELADTALFDQGQDLFDQQGDTYVLKTAQLGVPVGARIATPSIDGSVVSGPSDAPVTVVEYGDFACTLCSTNHAIVAQARKTYGDKVQYVYKHDIRTDTVQARDAARAAECARDQEKFDAYADILFARQARWRAVEGTTHLTTYARTARLAEEDFQACLAEDAAGETVAAHTQEARQLGLAGTPAIFVNDQLIEGVVTFATLKQAIDAELAGGTTTEAPAATTPTTGGATTQ